MESLKSLIAEKKPFYHFWQLWLFVKMGEKDALNILVKLAPGIRTGLSYMFLNYRWNKKYSTTLRFEEVCRILLNNFFEFCYIKFLYFVILSSIRFPSIRFYTTTKELFNSWRWFSRLLTSLSVSSYYSENRLMLSMINVITCLIWSHFEIPLTISSYIKTTGYSYNSVNVITFGLAQSDHIKRLLLYFLNNHLDQKSQTGISRATCGPPTWSN